MIYAPRCEAAMGLMAESGCAFPAGVRLTVQGINDARAVESVLARRFARVARGLPRAQEEG